MAEFMDANATLGLPVIPRYRTAREPETLRGRLAEVGIAGALVRHSLAADGHPAAGNEELDRALRGVEGVERMWAVMPHWTGEFPAPAELRRRMAASGARAVVAYPALHGWPLRASVAGPLLEMLEASRVPLFLPSTQADLGAVEEVLSRHPALPVVLCDVSYRIARELYPLLGRWQTLHLETSGYMVHRGLEDIARRFGASRLVFGTRYPTYNPGCAVAAVLYAELSPADRALVASGNLRRLLREARLA